MALSFTKSAFVEQTSILSVLPSCRNSTSGLSTSTCWNSSPFTITVRASRLPQKGSCIIGGQGYVRASLRARAAAAESNADAGEEQVTEVQLSGDETEVQELGDSMYSVRTLKNLVFKIGDGSKQFVMNSVGGVVGIFKKDKKQPELVAFEASNFESKDGKTALRQWTATELTMQHDQLVRIAIDLNYLIFAFSFFGWVRILEAVLAAFATNPAKLRKLTQATNAMDPLTVAWLAYNLRKPILGILNVKPTEFSELAILKGKLWDELHAFFERQWKVVRHSHSLLALSQRLFAQNHKCV